MPPCQSLFVDDLSQSAGNIEGLGLASTGHFRGRRCAPAAVTRVGDEPPSSGLPPVQTACIASLGKTMWPRAVASLLVTKEVIPLHDLGSSDTSQPDIPPPVNP